MKGVSKPLILIPVRGGKLDYNNKVIARPGDPDIETLEMLRGFLKCLMLKSSIWSDWWFSKLTI